MSRRTDDDAWSSRTSGTRCGRGSPGCGRTVAAGWARARRLRRRARQRGARQRMLELAQVRRRRPGARARLRAGGPGARGGRARRARRRGRADRRRRGDDRDRRRARRRPRPAQRAVARVLDLERIDEPDASYDVVLCREGLMFALEPGRAVAEIRRVLRPGGRVAVAVWAARERNPWLGLVMDAVSAQIGAPVPPPGDPGPVRARRRRRAARPPRRRGPGRRAGRGALRAAAGRVVRRVVGADVGARRPAVGDPRDDARGGHARRCASAPARPRAPTRPRRAAWTSRA